MWYFVRKLHFYGVLIFNQTLQLYREEKKVKKNLLLVAVLFFGLAVLIAPKAQAAEVGVGIGVKSASMHQEYPLETKGRSMQTKMGLKLKGETFSTNVSGSVDLIGHVSYDKEGATGQGIIASNLLQRNFRKGVSIEAKNILQVAESIGEGGMGVDNLSSMVSVSREIFTAVEGRIIGGGYYSHQTPPSFLLGAGLSKEVLSCKIEVDIWMQDTLSVTGRVSKEVDLHKFTLGTMKTEGEARVWFEMNILIDNIL